MKTIWAMALASFLLISGCVRKADQSADVQAIKNTMNEYVKAINSRNPDAAVAMMTDKTYCAEPNMPPVAGRNAICDRIRNILDRFASSGLDFQAPVEDVQAQDALGTARGSWTLKSNPRSGVLPPVDESGSWIIVCRQQGDGEWKWDSAVFTSEQPLPGRTMAGEDEKSLLQLEQNLASAVAKGSTKEGEQRRAQILGSLGKSYKLSSMTVRELNPRVFGDAAIVNLTGELQGTFNGAESSGTLKGVDFFVRRNGNWQLAYSQNTVSIP